MGNFLKKLFFFLSPLIVLFILIEYYCNNSTTFSIKKRYFENHRKDIETLFLGTSHMQNAINPRFLKQNAANVAFAGQPIEIDYALLQKYINQMDNLKTVVFDVSPHIFYSRFDSSDWNGHIYANLYEIYYKVNPHSIKNHSYLLSNFKFFTSIYIDYVNPWAPKYEINKFGYISNDFYDRFLTLKNDSLKIDKTFIMMHTFDGKDMLEKNEKVLESAIRLCKNKAVKVLLVTPPFYHTYNDNVPAAAKKEVSDLVARIQKKFNVPYFDFSTSKNFNLKDFKNDSHLNPNGAKKFTVKVDSLINQLK